MLFESTQLNENILRLTNQQNNTTNWTFFQVADILKSYVSLHPSRKNNHTNQQNFTFWRWRRLAGRSGFEIKQRLSAPDGKKIAAGNNFDFRH